MTVHQENRLDAMEGRFPSTSFLVVAESHDGTLVVEVSDLETSAHLFVFADGSVEEF